MKFLQNTTLLPTADELRPLTDDQNLAVLECLFITVIVDGKADPNEIKAFAASALAWPWNWGSPEVLKTKLADASQRLRGVQRADMKDHLKGLGARIPTPALREKTFAGMFALMIADGKLDEKEKQAALAFAAVFGIPQARAGEIVKEVTAALVQAMKK